MSKHCRIIGYCPTQDFRFIADSNGCFQELRQLSSDFVQRAPNVLEVGDSGQVLDGNMEKCLPNNEYMLAHATAHGNPHTNYDLDGTTCKAVKVYYKVHVPDKNALYNY